MIKHHEKITNNGLTVEVNWTKPVTPCKKIRFKIGDKQAVISNSDLYGLLMLLADDDQIDKLTKIKDEKVRAITKMIKVKTKKAIKEGGYVVFPMTYYVPESVYNKVAEYEGVLESKVSEEEAKKILNNS